MTKRAFRAGRNEQSVQENIELLTGQRGNGLDRAVTVRDLASVKLASVRLGSGGGYVLSQNPASGTDGDLAAYPTVPTGFEVNGGFSSIMLVWDMPRYKGHAYTEVWRSTTDVLTDAVLLATTPASVFGDIVTTGSTFYYWIRHVNIKNKPGAYNSTVGTVGETSQDISSVIDEIGEQMEGSELIQDLTSNIDSINANGSAAFQDMWTQKATAGNITAGIGILAGADGTSQVAISASQLFVFDPNIEDSLTPLLAVSDGTVKIPKTLIEEATIEVLQAQDIVADTIQAGIEIDTPILNSAVINGAEIHIGSLFNVTHEGVMTASSGTFSGRIEASDGYFNGDISASTMNGGNINGATITGSSIIGSQIYTGAELFLCFGDNMTTSRTYPFNRNIYVAASRKVTVETRVSAPWNGNTPNTCLDFYAAGDISMNFPTQNRARFRTIPANVIDIRVDRPRIGGSGFLGFIMQMVGINGNVIANVGMCSAGYMPPVGREFNVGGVVFYVYDSNAAGGGNRYGVRSFGVRNRRTNFGPGWTNNPAAVGRFRVRLDSTNDGGGTVTYRAAIDNSVDPR
ncbi:phage tail tip fiber protein [Vibrio spartinae]|uniref:Fibronectin type III protein n=1 Tax=Vibrio spartinae TaxID=1918945 RepID=A0A1N6M9I8_9VIBR|nr:DUF1983 domain-containing protein [Vibrio spartinae]SIO96094.1 Fibronectin type III protein [Vibrio spartinae]